MKKDDIMLLADVVRAAAWEDAKGTADSPSLVGPPAIEFSIYKKVPSSKNRTDARQGTIDQDPEFMTFLESLANPAQPKDGPDMDDENEGEATEPKVFTTPLVEFLKEKKANKGKETGTSKGGKKAREEPGSAKGRGKDSESGKRKGREVKEEKADKQPKENVKILTKKAASEEAAEAARAAVSQIASTEAPKSRRAGIAAAARILQRDLGLSPGSAHRKARQDAAKADAEVSKAPPKDTGTAAPAASSANNKPSSPAPSNDSAPQSTNTSTAKSSRRNRGGRGTEKGKNAEANPSSGLTAANPPMILKKKPETETTAAAETATPPATDQNTSSRGNQPSSASAATKGGQGKGSGGQRKPAIAADTTRAFVKHANASQGVTEPLLKAALESFGPVTFVEIDKRKGFGYVDFADHGALVKAMQASPVNVAQGAVQVLERKDKKAAAGGAANAGNQAEGQSATPATDKAEKGNKSDKPSGGRGRRGRGKGAANNANNNNNGGGGGGNQGGSSAGAGG